MKGIVAIALCLALSGCGPRIDQEPARNTVIRTYWVETVDGREIPCVWIRNGLSCDWSRR